MICQQETSEKMYIFTRNPPIIFYLYIPKALKACAAFSQTLSSQRFIILCWLIKAGNADRSHNRCHPGQKPERRHIPYAPPVLWRPGHSPFPLLFPVPPENRPYPGWYALYSALKWIRSVSSPALPLPNKP